jgi:hypothetical protein
MTFKNRIFIAIALALSGLAIAASVQCPIDNMNMVFTGQTKSEGGKLLYQYRCPSGHTTWVVK